MFIITEISKSLEGKNNGQWFFQLLSFSVQSGDVKSNLLKASLAKIEGIRHIQGL
jgi:hypothetical protein